MDFSIPDSGISIDSLVFYVRQFFNLYQTRISGEFVCASAECRTEGLSLRIRILRDKLEVIQLPPMGAQSEAEYFRAAAARVLGVLDPFLAAAVEVQTNPEAGLAQAERLVRRGDPSAVWALNLIGNTRRNLGQIDAAITAFQAALQIDPGFVIAQTNLGSALVDKGDFAAAGKIFDSVARAHPKDRFLALGRYRLAAAQGRTGAAIAEALKADAEDPGRAQYLIMAAQVAYGANDTAAAEGYFERALQVAPDDDTAVTLLSLLYQLDGDYPKAEAVMRRALALSPENVAFLITQAHVLKSLKRQDEALGQLDKALAVEPGNAAAQKLRAATLQVLERHQDALVQLAPLLQMGGTDAEIPLMQGQSLQALGQTEAAAKAYEAAGALDPASPYAILAKAYLKAMTNSP